MPRLPTPEAPIEASKQQSPATHRTVLTKSLIGVAEECQQGVAHRCHQVSAAALSPHEQHHHHRCGIGCAGCNTIRISSVAAGAQEGAREDQTVDISANHGALVDTGLGVCGHKHAGLADVHRRNGGQHSDACRMKAGCRAFTSSTVSSAVGDPGLLLVVQSCTAQTLSAAYILECACIRSCERAIAAAAGHFELGT